MLDRFFHTNHLDKKMALVFLALVTLQTILFISSPHSMQIYLFFVWYFIIYLLLITMINVVKANEPKINYIKKKFSLYCILIMEYTFVALLFSFPEKVVPEILAKNSDIYFLLIFLIIIFIMGTQIILWNSSIEEQVLNEQKIKEVALFPKVSKFIKVDNSNDDNLYYRVAIGLNNNYDDMPIIKIDQATKEKNGQFSILENTVPVYHENLSGQSDLDNISTAKNEIINKYKELSEKEIIKEIENIII